MHLIPPYSPRSHWPEKPKCTRKTENRTTFQTGKKNTNSKSKSKSTLGTNFSKNGNRKLSDWPGWKSGKFFQNPGKNNFEQFGTPYLRLAGRKLKPKTNENRNHSTILQKNSDGVVGVVVRWEWWWNRSPHTAPHHTKKYKNRGTFAIFFLVWCGAVWGAYYHHSIWDFLVQNSIILFCFGNIKKYETVCDRIPAEIVYSCFGWNG